MSEYQNNNKNTQWRIPMLVSNEIIYDFNLNADDVKWTLIEGCPRKVIEVPVTKEQYENYMRYIWPETKCECKEYSHYKATTIERNGEISLDYLTEVDAEPTVDDINEVDYAILLDELIAVVSTILPRYGHILRMLYDNETQAEIAYALGVSESTISEDIPKIRAILQPLVKGILGK